MALTGGPKQRTMAATAAPGGCHETHSGGPPHEKIMEAIRLFGDRVLPRCR